MGGIGSEDPELRPILVFGKNLQIRCGLSSRKVTHLVARIFLSKKSYFRCATFLEA